jgi:hypothetical protein
VSWQVLVKFAPAASQAFSFLLGSLGEREEFVRQPGIWWYHYPEEDDGWHWHRGPAWQPAHEVRPEQVTAAHEVPPRVPLAAMTAVSTAAGSGDDDARRVKLRPLTGEGEEDDSRW